METGDFDINKLEAGAAKRPGMSMVDIIAISSKNDAGKLPDTVAKWLLVYDEFGAWFGNLAVLLILNIMASKEESEITPQQRVMACLVGNISAQIVAIRKLVTLGFDVQAKQLLRVFVEHIDVALLLSKGGLVVDEFCLTLDGESANKFWHKYVSKGKARKSHRDVSGNNFEAEELTRIAEFENNEERILGMGVHPSLAASQMACLPDIDTADTSDTLGFFGRTTIFSERTLSYAVYHMMLYVMDGYLPKEEAPRGEKVFVSYFTGVQSRVFNGQRALMGMLTQLLPNWNHPTLTTKLDD